MYTFSNELISDLHKDARGFRPSEYFWEEWTQSPDNIKQKIWDNLIDEMNSAMDQQKQDEARALAEFRKIIADQMQTCNCTWNKAVEYLADAEDMTIDHEQDFDYFLWNQGIGYTDRLNIRKLYKEAA